MRQDEIRDQAAWFHGRIRRRNIFEYLAIAFVCSTFGWNAWNAHTAILRLGGALVVAGALFVAWQLHRLGSATHIPAELPVQAFSNAYRTELRRQLAALQKVPLWYIAPFVPGMALIIAGRTIERHDAGWGPLLGICAVMLAVCCGVWLINVLAAQRLKAEIAALEQAAGDTA